MCGIAGIVGSRAELDTGALLRALDHRGPDQRAERTPDAQVWMAATRLAIRDLSAAGDQPMSTPDGALTIVYNGEVYNAAALRSTLRDRGHAFRSTSDTEVVLYAYREWGIDALARLDGMFALGIWDGPRRRFVLARDPLGVKPLWLARRRDGFAFASEVRALLAGKVAGRSLSGRALASFLATGSVSEPDAMVRGVEAVPPGAWIAYADGWYTNGRTWSPPTREDPITDGDATALVRRALEASVVGCLESDVPIALLSSGGIDSAVLAILARDRPRLETFHVHVGHGAAKRAAALSRDLGLVHREVRVSSPDAEQALMAALSAQDQPSLDGANIYLVSRVIRDAGFKVALTGLGADELFLGYPLHRNYINARASQRVAGHWVPRLRRATAKVPGQLMDAWPGRWRGQKLLQLIGSRGPVETYHALRALFPEATQRELLRGHALAPPQAELTFSGSTAGEVTRLELSGYLVNTLLRDADTMSMAHGVELRVPMLSRDLAEIVLRCGPALKLRPGKKKPLLVEAVPELAQRFRDAPKEGFELPLEQWLLGNLRARVEHLFETNELTRLGLDGEVAAGVWRLFLRTKDRATAHRVWALVSLAEWARTHGISA